MSNFILHIKLATENIVLCSDTCSKKDHYAYAEKMEKMLKRQLKEELTEIVNDHEMMEEKLCEFIKKLEESIN
jgi:predicted house-cleaning noncanonical NTP pyrophosphatase (MazG superfamily)